MFPKAGGQYVYIKEAYGKLIGFLYGWSFAVIQTGTIAAVGVAFAKFAYLYAPLSNKNIYFIRDWDFKLNAAQIVSIFYIILLSYINSRG
jgi:APA family basic amino acid/polyamine antiporter